MCSILFAIKGFQIANKRLIAVMLEKWLCARFDPQVPNCVDGAVSRWLTPG